jgi:hypothetical protein
MVVVRFPRPDLAGLALHPLDGDSRVRPLLRPPGVEAPVTVNGVDYLPDEAFDVVQEIASLSRPERMVRELMLEEGPIPQDEEAFQHKYATLLVSVEGYLEDPDDD